MPTYRTILEQVHLEPEKSNYLSVDLAIGRKNWLHVMSDAGGKWTAILYSIIATCKLNNINPQAYLRDVLILVSIRDKDASVADLTPVEWLKKRNGGKLPPKQPLYPSKG